MTRGSVSVLCEKITDLRFKIKVRRRKNTETGARIKRVVRFVLPASWEERDENETELLTKANMPVNRKFLQGVIMAQHAHTVEEKKRAVEAGTLAYLQGDYMCDCPKEFLPRPGDSVLYDNWVTGFKAASIADGGAD